MMSVLPDIEYVQSKRNDLIEILKKIVSKIEDKIHIDHSVFATNFCNESEIVCLEFESDNGTKTTYSKYSLLGSSIIESRSILVQNIKENLLYHPSIDNPFHYDMKSMLVVPCSLKDTDSIFGILLLYRNKDHFNSNEMKIVESLIKKFTLKNNDKLEKIVSPFSKCIQRKLIEPNNYTSKVSAEHLREFFSSVIHDIRTPMNAVIGFLELIREDVTDTEREYADAALKSAEMVTALVSDVLDFNKIVSGNLAIDLHYFSLPEELESSSRLFYHTARKKKIDLISYFDPDIPYAIKSDPFRIKQIVNNLLSNAIKFTGIGGEVDLEVFYEKEEDKLIINVKDNGIGINQNSLKTIFEPFKQADSKTSSKYGGTGLGLSISKKLADMLGGNLTVISKAGEGSTFTLTLPCNTIPATPKYLEYLPSEFPRIYLVEGDESKHRYIKYYYKYFDKLGIPCEKIDYKDVFNTKIDPNSILIAIKFNYESEVTQNFIDKYLSQLIMIQHNMFIKLKDKHKNLRVIEAPIFPEKLFDTLLNFKKRKIPTRHKKASSNKKILVVDDNAINRKLMEEIATRLGSEVYSASDGEEAIKVFSKYPVDLIFIDQNMPILSGTAAIKKIRSLPGGDNVSIFGLTGSTDDKTVKSMIEAGANSILSKPVQMNKLKEIILK